MGLWKSILPRVIWEPLNDLRRDHFPNSYRSYSGEGEDLIIQKIFNHRTNGFYVDVGCYHPKINSNTFILYTNGWSGINIDANPDSIKKFDKLRKKDVNINVGIAQNKGELTYYTFDEPAVNTFSKELYEERKKLGTLTYLGEQRIAVEPLRDVLDRLHLKRTIDVLDIDVEGFDLEVLASNDWEQYLPNIILVEEQTVKGSSFESLDTHQFLVPKGYQLIAKTFSTVIYGHKTFLSTIT